MTAPAYAPDRIVSTVFGPARERDEISRAIRAVRSLSDMANDPSLTSPPEWIVRQFFERGTLNSVYGIGKGGKSTLLAHLAVHVGLGASFAGYDVTAGRVLWVDLEQGQRRLLRNFMAVPRWEEADIIVDSDLSKVPRVADLHALIELHEPALVIVDSLSKLCQVPDDNDNGAWQIALAPLEAMARTSRAAVVVIDHDRKGEGSHGRGMRGASSKLAAFDTAIHVTRGEQSVRKLEVVSREVGDFTVSLERTEDGYRVAGGTVDRVLEILQAAGQPLTVGVLHKSLERSGFTMSEKSVRDHLKRLEGAGSVTASGTGLKNDPKLYEARKND